MFRQFMIGTLASAALIGGHANAAGDDSGFYAGLGVGRATNENDDFKLESNLLRPFVGYSFNKYFAVEVAYVDPEEADDTVGPVRLTLDPKGVVTAATVGVPLTEHWSIFGKLGWAFYDVDQTIRIDDLAQSESESDDDLVYGAGTAVRPGDRFELRLDYEVVDVPDGDFDSFTLSGIVRF